MKVNHALLLMPLLLLSCGRNNEGPVSIAPVDVNVSVVAGQMTGIPVEMAGRITTRDEIRLSFKKGGIVGEVLVQEGETVARGQVLARLKQDEFVSASTQAELAVEKAERDFDRAASLYHDSVATLEQYQNAQTAIELARQTLSGTLFNVEHTVIRAPANGKILKKLASADEIVGEGMPVILFGSTDSRWVMNVSLPDKEAVRIGLGDSARIRLDAWPGVALPAAVTEISGMADPYTGTFEVELMLDPVNRDLAVGLIGNAVLYPSDSSRYWLVPAGALIEGSGHEARIYELRNGRARELILHVTAVRGGLLYAVGYHGDTLFAITSGHQFITEGSLVKPVN